MHEKIKQLIRDGEGVAVDFKRCEQGLTNSVYETVSAFSNRYGGHILLGVDDDGKIRGIPPRSADGLKKNFVNSLNNPQRFSPTLYITLEEVKIGKKLLLWCYVPPGSQLVMFNGKIYDRAEDGDMDITRNSELVAQMHRRKAADYSERRIFPHAKDAHFDFARLMPKVRRLASNRLPDHPWSTMTDAEILQSAGLFQTDLETGKSGYTLAAILLFGRDEVIRSCTPNYVTDAICRRENTDRFDDRLMVTTNLIDAYEQLIDFIAKHTSDKFFLVGDQSVSVRSKIAREIVSNILVHREYTRHTPQKSSSRRIAFSPKTGACRKIPAALTPTASRPTPKTRFSPIFSSK